MPTTRTTRPKAKPVVVDSYWTDGEKLVRVVWVDDHEMTVELEDARLPEADYLAITVAELRKNWKPIVAAVGD